MPLLFFQVLESIYNLSANQYCQSSQKLSLFLDQNSCHDDSNFCLILVLFIPLFLSNFLVTHSTETKQWYLWISGIYSQKQENANTRELTRLWLIVHRCFVMTIVSLTHGKDSSQNSSKLSTLNCGAKVSRHSEQMDPIRAFLIFVCELNCQAEDSRQTVRDPRDPSRHSRTIFGQ